MTPSLVDVSPPQVISWNLTARCPLSCDHCYLSAGGRQSRDGELSTQQCLDTVDQIGQLNPATVLILTGGEPLLRSDLERIAERAAGHGMLVVVGSSGITLTPARAGRLAEAGVAGVGISLDSDQAEFHDNLRGMPGAWAKATDGMRSVRDAGMALSVQMTILRGNHERLEQVAEHACAAGARVMTAYFLVCTGRAHDATDLSPVEYERVCARLRDLENKYREQMMVAAKCAPHYRRIVHELEGPSAEVRSFGAGCPAGRDYLRIGPRGEVTPCPYLPLSVGRLDDEPLAALWHDSPVFRALRERHLSGRCGRCEYQESCGGCRARAYAVQDDLNGEDPSCRYVPTSRRRLDVVHGGYGKVRASTMQWQEGAAARLQSVPSILRSMVVRRTEAAAREAGDDCVTVEHLTRLRQTFMTRATQEKHRRG